jgi:hypothetical protein
MRFLRVTSRSGDPARYHWACPGTRMLIALHHIEGARWVADRASWTPVGAEIAEVTKCYKVLRGCRDGAPIVIYLIEIWRVYACPGLPVHLILHGHRTGLCKQVSGRAAGIYLSCTALDLIYIRAINFKLLNLKDYGCKNTLPGASDSTRGVRL